MEKQKESHGKEQARLQFETVKALVERIRHIEEEGCGGLCLISDEQLRAGLNLHETEDITDEDFEDYHDQEQAREAVQNDPLEVAVRSGWEQPGAELEPAEYYILLCTGGPAVRITGALDEHGEPVTARLEFQDWFTYWERYPADEQDLLTYARLFVYNF